MTRDQAMFLVQQYAQLIQGEFPATCKVLRAVTERGRSYRPDPKSRTAWQLAVHLATSDVWFLDSVRSGVFTMDPAVAAKAETAFDTVASLAAFYERTLPDTLNAVQAMSPADLVKPLDFFGLFQWPAVSFVGFANNHSVHHRGQLAAYLRALGSCVPAIYGSSADEPLARPESVATGR